MFFSSLSIAPFDYIIGGRKCPYLYFNYLQIKDGAPLSRLFFWYTIEYFLCTFQKFGAGNQHYVSAAAAFDPHVSSQLQYLPIVGATGMRFLHHNNVANLKFYKFHSFSPHLFTDTLIQDTR